MAAGYVAGCLVWAIPLVVLAGGPSAYLQALFNQGAEDFSGVVMLWTTPTVRQLARALQYTFVSPWGSVAGGGRRAVLLPCSVSRCSLFAIAGRLLTLGAGIRSVSRLPHALPGDRDDPVRAAARRARRLRRRARLSRPFRPGVGAVAVVAFAAFNALARRPGHVLVFESRGAGISDARRHADVGTAARAGPGDASSRRARSAASHPLGRLAGTGRAHCRRRRNTSGSRS